MKLKQNGTGTMTRAKNAVFIELKLKNCYLEGGGIKIWWVESTREDEQIFGHCVRTPPPSPRIRMENLDMR